MKQKYALANCFLSIILPLRRNFRLKEGDEKI